MKRTKKSDRLIQLELAYQIIGCIETWERGSGTRASKETAKVALKLILADPTRSDNPNIYGSDYTPSQIETLKRAVSRQALKQAGFK